MTKAKIYTIEPQKYSQRKNHRGCVLSFLLMVGVIILVFFAFQRSQVLSQAKRVTQIPSSLSYETAPAKSWENNTLFVGMNYLNDGQIGDKVPTVIALVENHLDGYHVKYFSKDDISQLGKAITGDPRDNPELLSDIAQTVIQESGQSIHYTLVVDFEKLEKFHQLAQTNQYVFSDAFKVDQTPIEPSKPVTLTTQQIKQALIVREDFTDEILRRQMEVYYFDLHLLNQKLLLKESEFYCKAFFEAVFTNVPDENWWLQAGLDLLNQHRLKWES